MFHDFLVHGEVEVDPASSSFYERLTDAYIAWSHVESLKIMAGKQSAPFTMDGSTSSKELLAIDRSNLSNNLWFPEEYMPGVSASGKPGAWNYFMGFYSAGTANKNFGNFDGGWFLVSTIGRDFAEELGVKKAELNLNYVYNEGDNPKNFTRPFADVGSLNFNYDAGKWGWRADVAGGLGQGKQSDVWGTMVMPYYNITPKLQAVARYTYLQSGEPNGVRMARYENMVVAGRGDLYQEFYLGLNYYFYKQKLKVQTGVQYADMRDQANDGGEYAGWAATVGLRVSW